MIQLSELLKKPLKIAQPEPVNLEVANAIGHRLAQSYFAENPVPDLPISSVDGFAVRAVDVEGAAAANPIELEVVGEIAAGQMGEALSPNQAAPIMTGAPIPQGADSCVMVEDTKQEESKVLIRRSVEVGAYVRTVGSAIRKGQLVAESNQVLTPAAAAGFESLGVTEVSVHAKLRVAIASTGLELVPVEEVPTGAQVRDVNRGLLRQLLTQANCEVVDLGIVSDNRQAVVDLIGDAKKAECSVLITTGGVSMGRHDYVKALSMEKDNALAWHQVAIKPAKPLVIGEISDLCYFGLPGNPVSCLVSFTLIVGHYLRRSQGLEEPGLVTAKLSTNVSKADDMKVHYRAGRISFDGGALVQTFGEDSSHQINSFGKANCLVELTEPREYKPGDQVSVHLLNN